MTKPTHAMTLRLSPEIAEAVENRAYENGYSQADWIRSAIRRSLVEEHEDEMRRSAPTSTL
jgi:predicted DNA-binding protein